MLSAAGGGGELGVIPSPPHAGSHRGRGPRRLSPRYPGPPAASSPARQVRLFSAEDGVRGAQEVRTAGQRQCRSALAFISCSGPWAGGRAEGPRPGSQWRKLAGRRPQWALVVSGQANGHLSRWRLWAMSTREAPGPAPCPVAALGRPPLGHSRSWWGRWWGRPGGNQLLLRWPRPLHRPGSVPLSVASGGWWVSWGHGFRLLSFELHGPRRPGSLPGAAL